MNPTRLRPRTAPGALLARHRNRSKSAWVGALLASGLTLRLLAADAPAAASATEAPEAGPKPKPARLSVRGLGAWNNRVAVLTLRKLWPEKKLPPTLAASFVEDAALLLRNQLAEKGFLNARLQLAITRPDQTVTNVVCDGGPEFYLPSALRARALRIQVERGVRYHFQELEFENLGELSATRARGFFFPVDSLLPIHADRPYHPGRFQRSLRNLRLELAGRGYRDARVEVKRLERDDATGEVRATIRLNPGPRFIVRELKIVVRAETEGEVIARETRSLNRPWTPLLAQDLAEELKRDWFAQGYADATARVEAPGSEPADHRVLLDLEAEVIRGPRIKLGAVKFAGAKHTRDWLLRRKTHLTGPYLNRLEADRGRDNLSRLGIFKSVYVTYPAATNAVAHTRGVRYQLEEGRRVDLRFLFGWGSYDQLFGGLELDQFNLWGVGHHSRLYAVQSLKSTIARYTYSIPEFLTTDLTAFADADLLHREELTFDRNETRFGTGLRKTFPALGQQVGLRYSYQLLQSEKTRDAATLSDLPVAAAILDWSIEQRNNPLIPRRGFKAGVNLELAQPELGGEASYQRIEVHFSYHRPLARATWLHLGFWHGVTADFLFDNGPLPFNKRFFPGGETSIRGYEQGGASPVNARGDQLGAESSLVGNLELEQGLTRHWSLVGFVDVAGITPDIDQYPFDEVLVSAGAGVRWNTPVGPVRLEYGHNLTPRPSDPDGTVHFSIGFPF